MRKLKLLSTLPLVVTGLALASCGPTSYNAEKVANDWNANVTEAGHGEILSITFTEQYGWSGGCNFGASTDESEANLKTAITTLAQFVPDYLEMTEDLYGDPTQSDYYDLFGDNSIYYYRGYVTPDEKASFVIISYIYNSKLCAQFEAADVKAAE